MTRDHVQVWQNCLALIQEKVPVQSYNTWFEPVVPVNLEGSILTIQVPNRFFYEWLEEHYINVLKEVIKQEIGEEAKLKYLIPKQKTSGGASVSTNKLQANPVKGNNIKNPFVIPGIQKMKIDPQLNPNYTFENYIEGDCNRLARSAGLAIAERPGKTAFNPLMIYGDVGLGKTHLAQAIGNEAVKNYPEKIVLYVSSEKFTNQFIDTVRNNAIMDFLNFYQLVDILILDDIQFLENKQKTQDIFFTIFNHLHQSGKQLILTSDRPPKELEGIEDRLISRFKWGLSADLQVPSLETRMAIIQQKMDNDGVDLPSSVVEFVSFNVRSNVREMEGVLISIIAQAALNQREIDLGLAKEVVSKFVDNINNEITVEFIQKIVAEHYNIPLEKLREKTRKRFVVRARQLSMYLAKQLSNKSLKHIGKAFGGRDHSTVIHACKSIEMLLENDTRFKNEVTGLAKRLKSTGA